MSISAPAAWIVGVALAIGIPAAAEEQKRRITGSFGAILTSEYVLQGLVFEKKGVIAQPNGRITLSLAEPLDVFAGFFLSIHDAHTDAGLVNPPGTPKRRRALYEADWFAGATAKHERWSLMAMYWEMLSPSDAFETARAIEMVLAFADRDLLADGYALDPYVNAYVETDEKSGSGTDEGWYLQLGVKPNHTIETIVHPLTISLPTSVGFGFEDFYARDERWGYFSTGLAATAMLAPFVPADLGAWSLTPAFAYWRVNEDAQLLDVGPNRYVWSVTLNVDF